MSRRFSPSPKLSTSLLTAFALLTFASTTSPALASENDDKPGEEGEVEPDEKIVLKLSLTDPKSENIIELRQAVKTGESFQVPLEDGSSLTIRTGEAKKEGQVRLGLAYETVAQGETKASKEETSQDCDLPGEVNWSPVEGGPAVHVSVRPHHKIKLVLDGDPLA